MSHRALITLLCLLACLVACGTTAAAPPATARPRETQIAQLTQVAAAVEGTASARIATQTAQAIPTATATAAPTATLAPTATPANTPTIRPSLTRPPVGGAPREATNTPTMPVRTSQPAATGVLPTSPTAPRNTPTPRRPDPSLPYFDTLTAPYGGWPISNSPYYLYSYTPTGFQMRIMERGIWAENVSRVLPEVADVSVEVDTWSLGEPVPGNGYGILCRYKDAQNWYAFVVGTDRRYWLVRMVQGNEAVLTVSPASNGLVPEAPAPSRLRVDCIGDTLTLSINGIVAAQIHDASLTSGRVGMYACTCGGRGVTDVRFTNMVIWRPDPAAPSAPAPAPPAP